MFSEILNVHKLDVLTQNNMRCHVYGHIQVNQKNNTCIGMLNTEFRRVVTSEREKVESENLKSCDSSKN